MVGIDNSVKVAKLISDLNSTIENLKRENEYWRGKLEEEIERYVQERQENSNLSDKLKDINWQNDCLDGANKGIHAANKVLVERLNDEKEQKEKHIEFNKQLMSDLDKTVYERDKNRELADNYAAEAYEWQKKYYHEKEKHEKATKKITELQHDLEIKAKVNTKLKKETIKLYRKYGVNKYGVRYIPKHAKKKDISEDKEEILDRCDFIDSEVKAWWNNRILTEEFTDAINESVAGIKELISPYWYINFNVTSLCNTILYDLSFALNLDSDGTIKDIQECVDKIRQTVKEAE